MENLRSFEIDIENNNMNKGVKETGQSKKMPPSLNALFNLLSSLKKEVKKH